MPEITNFEQFVKRVLEILFWVLIILPMVVIPLFYLFYVLQVEIQCNFQLLNCSHQVNWSLALYMFDPTKMNPLDPNSYISQLGLGTNSVLFRVAAFPGLTFVSVLASFVIWYERKLLAKMQYRTGPMYAGRLEGWLQSFADLFKLLFKEVVIPAKADALFFMAAPFAYMALAAALLSTIPVGPQNYIINSSFSLLIAFAIIGFFPVVTLLAGWASNNKFSFIGGIRALYQMISYEIPMILSLLGVVILSKGSLNLINIVESQGKVWFIIPMIVGAVVFYLTALAEVERVPFDIPEAESEIVAGWLTEYTSMSFGVINLAIYIKLYSFAALFTVLFLGGWAGPAPVPAVLWFMIKTVIMLTVFIIPRGFSGRIRLDQLIGFGWLWLIALSFVNIFIAVVLRGLGIF